MNGYQNNFSEITHYSDNSLCMHDLSFGMKYKMIHQLSKNIALKPHQA